MSNHDHDSACRPNCQYRRLYEGSQVSLTDMSARQGSALSRVGRLRASVVTTLRRAFPEQAAVAEAHMGRRLADVDDEILLTFLDSLLKGSTGREERAALEALGSVLVNAGLITDPKSPPTVWIQEIQNSTRAARRVETKPPVAATPPPVEPPRIVEQPMTVPLNTLFIGDIDEGWDTEPDQTDNIAVTQPLGELFGEDQSQPTPLIELWDDELLGDPTLVDTGWSPSPVRPTEAPLQPAPPAAAPPPTAMEHIVRPELFPSQPKAASRGRGSTKKKATRLQAQPADDETAPNADENQSAGTDDTGLDDGLRQAFLAACSIPRPVFTRDLVSIAGSLDLVSAWEDECREHPEITQVRFVSPKARHRTRGSLVVPGEQMRIPSRRAHEDWWGQALEKYFGARLYELGVLLHRVGDELVGSKFGDHIVTLRLNSPRGLVGMVISVDDRLEAGEPGREALAQALEELFAERLTLAAVLTTAGEERDLLRLKEAVTSLAAERSWEPAFPVVSARSWEYADDRGSTARVILGG